VPTSRPTDLSCIVHVHSTYSDGTATMAELVDAARTAGADVLLVTDHDTLQARRDGWERWHGDLLVIVGEEISPRGGHLLAFDIPEEIEHAGRSEAELCRAVAAAGGLAIAAHPFSEGPRLLGRLGRAHAWPALREPCCHGIELWSLTTDVAESWATPREALAALRRPEHALTGPPRRHLRLWDELCRDRRVVAVGGLDGHQPGLRLRGRVWSVMPHARWFEFLRTQVIVDHGLTGDAAADVRTVLAALREGRCYLARVDLGDPRGFSFRAEVDGGTPVSMGTERRAQRGRLTVQVPASAELRLLRDGALVEQHEGARLDHDFQGPGVFRVEAWRSGNGRHQPWLISNPIYLR
jgi:hypothetical protein